MDSLTETIVFAGPSWPQRFRPTSLAVTWCGPAARGDLDGLAGPPGTRVVLVDGYLVHRHPPSPSEVYRLVERRFEVWGCSSLGALRAVELRDHGVRGSGWVYDRVLDRTITADDELVALLDPRTDEAVGVFVANVRHGLQELVEDGRATLEQAARILEAFGSLHYTARTPAELRRLAGSAGLAAAAVRRLAASDVKRIDVVGIVEMLTGPAPSR